MKKCAHAIMQRIKRMKNWSLTSSFALILVFLLASVTPLEPVGTLILAEVEASYSTPLVFVEPPISLVYVNETWMVNVNVFNVTDLYGFDFKLGYDTTFLNATEVVLGSFLNPPYSIIIQEIDDTLGMVWFAATSISPAEPVNGSGTLATINFTVIAEGDTVLNLYDTKLDNFYGNPISHDLMDGHLHTTIKDVVEYVPGELLVEFYADVTGATINETIARLGTRVRSSSVQLGLGDYTKLYWLKIVGDRSVWETVYLFKEEPTVMYAEPLFSGDFEVHQRYPNDPWFPHQWGICNAGQVTVARETPTQNVTAADPDISTELVPFTERETHQENVQRNDAYDSGEFIYLDQDNDRWVSANDTRLTPVKAGRRVTSITYPEGSSVSAGDLDETPAPGMGFRLVPFRDLEKHDERVNANGRYDYGEWIYLDSDNDSHTSVDDARLFASGTIDADIDAPQAWSIMDQYNLWRNENPIVAIIDSGVDSNHPDLNHNLIAAFPPQDTSGHGTHVAGIVGAVGNNNLDVAGVNWQAQMVVLRGGNGTQFHQNMLIILILKIRYGVNIRVINRSGHFIHTIRVGGRWYTRELYDPIAMGLIALAGQNDILFVTSAGNGAFDNDVGEYIYRDNDGNNRISVNDTRLTNVTAFHPGPAHPPLKDATRTYPANSIVQAGDWDAIAGTDLITFATEDLDRDGILDPPNPALHNDHHEDVNGDNITDLLERYVDSAGTGNYSVGEPIYWDRASNGVVDAGDMRLTSVAGMPAGSFVSAADPDNGTVLHNFTDTERHVDNKHIDGRARRVRSNGLYDGPAHYPSNYPLDNIIAVAASDHLDHISDLSNYGKTTVDLAAPGEDIISLAISRPGQRSNVTVKSGTSMAAPHVTGVASLAFAMFPERTALEVKQDILDGTVGTLWPCLNVTRVPPASGVDRRPPFGAPYPGQPPALRGKIVESDGRLRWPYTGDLGDAPHNKPIGGDEEYDTIACLEGALHWDTGNEWFGFPTACSNEVGALWPEPHDEDILKNPNLPCMTIPDHDDFDHPQPPNFRFDPPPPWVPGQLVTVYYYISTNYLGVDDAEGGRYQSIPSRMIYVNGFFDWNWNKKFDPEHTIHQPHDLSAWAAPGSRVARSPPHTSILPLSSTFIAQGSIPRWIRFRLDYGEDVSLVNSNPTIPDPPVTDPAWGLPGFLPDPVFPVWEHRGRARFGEVEDWPLCLKRPSWPWAMFGCDLTRAGYSVSAGPCTNNLLWTCETGGAIYSSPAVAEGKVYVGSSDNNVYAIDAETGNRVWNYTTGGWVDSSPAVADGGVFVGSWDGILYALDAETGNLVWKYTTGDAIVSSPSVADGKVFVGSSDGKFYALDAETGNLVWWYTVGDYIDSSPAVVDGKVFFGSWDGFVYALGAETGNRVWRYNTGDAIVSSPAVVDGKLYIGSMNGKMYCLDAESGSLEWTYTTGGPIKGSPAVTCGKVFIGSVDGNVYALDAETGTIIWKSTIEAPLYSSPAVACKRKVFIASFSEKPSQPPTYNFTDPTEDLIHIYTGKPVSPEMYLAYLDVVESKIELTNQTLEFSITVNGGIPPLEYTTFWTVMMDRDNDPEDNSQDYPTNDVDTMYSIIYDSTTEEWKIERAIYKPWGWDVTPTDSVWSMISAYPDGRVIMQISVPLEELPEFLPVGIPWKVKTETFNGASIGDLAPDEGLAYLSFWHGRLYSLDAETGTILWTYETEGQIHSSPAVANSTLFIGSFDGSLYAFRSLHDVTITKAVPLKTIVGEGFTLKINATVENKGDFKEPFDVVACANSTVVHATSSTVDKGSSATVTLEWNTTGWAKGNYILDVYVVPVPYEYESMKDNAYHVDVHVCISIAGDVNFDGQVKIKDIASIARAFGSSVGEPRYHPNYDIDGDGAIKIRDIAIAARNFGRTA